MPSRLLFHDYLQAKGVNSFKGATQLCYIRPSKGYKDAENAKWLMEQVLYLPISYSVGDTDLRDTIERTVEAYKELMQYFQSPNLPKPTKVLNKKIFE